MARQSSAKVRKLEPAEETMGTLLRAPVAAAATAVAKKIRIGQLLAESGKIGKLGVGQVVLGQTTIKKVVLQNIAATVKSGQAFLQSVHINLELKFRLDWWVGVRVGPLSFSRSGSTDLGSLSLPMALGDIAIPSLQNINLQIPTMSASNLKASLAPIANLALGASDFKRLEAVNTDLPADGFALGGLGLGSLSLSAVEAPKTLTEKAKLDELRMQGDVVLPGAEMTNLQMPDAAAGDIASQAFVFDARPTPRGVGANLGFMGVSITVTPIANTTIGAMVLKDMKLAAMIGKLKIEEIRVPLSVLGVTLQQISLEGVKVAQVSL